jgi:glycosyltransferase involved in cell wall biosynthesis
VGFLLIIISFTTTFLQKNYMSKINVLVLPSDKSGVGKFRSVDPHVKLQNLYPNDFHIDIDYEPKLNDVNYWKKYQIVHFHRSFGNIDQCPELIKALQNMGIILIMDLDDYWLPTIEHPIHQLIMENKMHQKIVANLKVADYVTTTTEIFAQEIRKFNKNVVVLPNAIDPSESQFNQPTPPSDKIRVGWLGGSSHLHDLKLLDGMVSKLSPLKDKLQYYVCGFDTRGTVTEINKQTGEQTQRAIKPEETVWVKYEEIFTNNYKIISPEYRTFLDKFDSLGVYPNVSNENYVRVWTRPVETYAGNYSNFDISLAPIKNHIFNRMKSQLKVIEAGFYKKALIASNVGPYTIDLKHALKNGEFNDGNALLVDDHKNHSDWAKYVKKLVDNPNMITDLGERLYETVKDKYHLNTVTTTRAEFYKSLIK